MIGNKSRVFKVIKTPVDAEESEALPAHMKDLLGFEFLPIEDGTPLELDPNYGPEFNQRYLKKVALLAQDIAQLLKILRADGDGGKCSDSNVPSEPSAPSKPAVYLAECSYDRKQARELLEGELKRLGYQVLPDKRLPQDEAEYVTAVESLLARCALSVHLVGEKYGTVPDGPSDKSASILQNELSVARSRSGGLQRLIWLPQGTRSEQAPQQTFIKALHQDAQAQFGADLIAGDIEELRAAIHDTLTKIEQPEPKQSDGDSARAQPATAGGSKMIYLISDVRDRKGTVPVRKLCRQLGFEVALPAFEGDASEVRQANQQQLASCDGVVLFYGTGDETWKRTIDNELKKMAGVAAAQYLGGRGGPISTDLPPLGRRGSPLRCRRGEPVARPRAASGARLARS